MSKSKGNNPIAPKVEAPKVEAPKAETLKKRMIRVRAVKFSMHEPFQNILLTEGSVVPVEDSSWIQSQIQHNLLEEVK